MPSSDRKTTTYFYVAQSSLLLTGLQADLTAARGSYLHLMVISLSGTAETCRTAAGRFESGHRVAARGHAWSRLRFCCRPGSVPFSIRTRRQYFQCRSAHPGIACCRHACYAQCNSPQCGFWLYPGLWATDRPNHDHFHGFFVDVFPEPPAPHRLGLCAGSMADPHRSGTLTHCSFWA